MIRVFLSWTIATAVAASGSTLWEGRAGAARLDWRTHAVRVQPPDSGAFDLCRVLCAAGADCVLRPKSVVGRYVGLYLSEDETLETHTDHLERYVTFDVSRHREVRASQLFDAAALRRALLADRWVRTRLGHKLAAMKKKKLGALLAELGSQSTDVDAPDATEVLADGDFVLHHVRGDKVAVRFGIECYGGHEDTICKQVGLLLPIPRALKGALRTARERKAGFLTPDAKHAWTHCP